MNEFFVAHDKELDVYPHGYAPVGAIISGLLMTRREWPALGITVIKHYDPDSSPPRMISRIVEYD